MSGPTLLDRNRYLVWGLCLRWAQVFPGQSSTQTAYLLFGTAAHESGGFRHVRQVGFSMSEPAGGWGWWQLERVSVLDSIRRLYRNPRRARRCLNSIDRYAKVSDMVTAWESNNLMTLLCSDHNMACMFARLHYLSKPDPIPSGVTAQADYWKVHYNTEAGRGTPSQYIESWEKYCKPILGGT